MIQGLVLSPLIGALLGVLFSGLSSSPSQTVPVTIIKTREVYREKVIKEYSGERPKRQSDNDDGLGWLCLLCLGALFILWKYAIHAEQIQYYIGSSILTILSFSVVTMMISYFKGHFTSQEWWLYTVAPVGILMACVYVLNLAKNSFDSRITEVAMNNSFMGFYLEDLSDYGKVYMLVHVFGVVFLVIVVALTGLSLLFYLSLMNQRSYSSIQRFWRWMARITSFFSGSGWLVLAIICLVLSYLGIHPNMAAAWIM
ncbi:hypothetical protein GZ77_26265 [Endozoicomonas montiporae]|uniref:Uncharacterized protein n=2 Tax=Endozoicomonas montiporae TaxID=1027273 RepID=A0A081MYI8_9GAMM|nr:hypothetical protein GZ77_26265 [Endozoicomonas montiporae]